MFWRRPPKPLPLPPAHELIEIERLAVDLAAEAGRRTIEAFRGGSAVEYKGKGEDNPVTEADRASEDLIRAGIAARFPDHCVIGEERQDVYRPDTAYLWVIDPIDGTTNFVNGLPLFAVSIGVLHHFRPVVGAIFVPNGTRTRPGVFHARLGGGAWCDDEPIRVAGDPKLTGGRTVARPGTFPGPFAVEKKLWRRLGEPRVLGSIAYELCYVAAGSLGYALFGSPKIWDIAAGLVIVREAGGLNLTQRRRGGWRELIAFEPGRRRAKEPLAHFRSGLDPLLVASPAVAQDLARGLRFRWPSLWQRLRRRVARWRK